MLWRYGKRENASVHRKSPDLSAFEGQAKPCSAKDLGGVRFACDSFVHMMSRCGERGEESLIGEEDGARFQPDGRLRAPRGGVPHSLSTRRGRQICGAPCVNG